MTTFNVDLSEEVAALLEQAAAAAGVAPEEVAARAVADFLVRHAAAEPVGEVDEDPLAWLGTYGNEDAQSERIEDLLAEGFGR